MLPSRTLSVSIACSPTKAYDFIRDPRNLPQWAPAFCKSVRPEGDNWIVDTTQGPVDLRFTGRNALGVLDHYVSPAPGVEIYVPMRVLRNESGCEVIFTLFRPADMSDERYAEDAGFVQQDLNTLKAVLEGSSRGGPA